MQQLYFGGNGLNCTFNPIERDSEGNTPAMYAAMMGRAHTLYECFDHDPELVNNDGNTVAMLQAARGKMNLLNSRWYHKADMRNKK